MFNSPFANDKFVLTIPQDAEIIFAADVFIDDYPGGAELTTEALIDSSPFNVFKLHTKDITAEILEQGQGKHWIFGNFHFLDLNLIPTVVANISYSMVEYDFKYCRYRSPEKHKAESGNDCDCHNDIHGKMISTLMYGAKSLWWMSEAQMNSYHDKFPFLAERDNVVLSSVFNDRFFAAVKFLRHQSDTIERSGWLVLGSQSWVKGSEDAVKYCEDNELEFEVLTDLPYGDVLDRMSKAEGFVYLPRGADTCPRMVIEAKLLGCKLQINEHVQHAHEIWFDTDDQFDTEAYLYAARERFWNGIKHAMSYRPTLSGYTTIIDCEKSGYPWRQSIESMLGFCDEVVVVDGGSTDGCWEELLAWSEKEEKLHVHLVKRDWDHPRFAVYDGLQKAAARSRCTMQYCWQQDADEVIHENDYEKIQRLLTVFPTEVDIVSLPVIEYWGSVEKVRLDVTPWKWRVSRNLPHITHGIPSQFRVTDSDGYLHAMPGTDGCDYINKDTSEPLAHASFYGRDAHNHRVKALENDAEATKIYQAWFARNIEMLPSTHHYSWFNLGRKIRTYRDYWSKHWRSLYDISQEDTSENNMFFDKPWSEVSDDDIDSLAVELSEKLGGWVFHSKVDFTNPTPYLTLDVGQPTIMITSD